MVRLSRSHCGRALIALASAAAVSGLAGQAQAATLRGAVVHLDGSASSFAVAAASGRLYAVRSRRLPALGSEVVVQARPLLDGTYRFERLRVVGHVSHRIRIRGRVSSTNPLVGRFTVSAPGVSMVVRRPGVSLAHLALDYVMPPIGADVIVTGTVDGHGDLEDQSVLQVQLA